MLMPFSHYLAPALTGTVMTAGTNGTRIGYEEGSFGSIVNPDLESGTISLLRYNPTFTRQDLKVEGETSDYYATITIGGTDYALTYVGVSGTGGLYKFSEGAQLFFDGVDYEVEVST